MGGGERWEGERGGRGKGRHYCKGQACGPAERKNLWSELKLAVHVASV